MNKVAILLGSASDKHIIDHSIEYYEYFGVDVEVHVMSAHRNPDKVADFAQNARKNGYKILIGGAGMAAHLAGALKANSVLPVIGLPLPGGLQDGLDSLMSTVQMPKGVPVATMCVGKAGAINAAILCAEIFALSDTDILDKLLEFKKSGCVLSGS
tara:strand:- start:706 stop:1173 length:468 start_codon:yes stop_codon:yes gene_type:complete